jgi:hypothetical protein
MEVAMSSPSPTPPPPKPGPSPANASQTDFNIGEEYGTARKSLPPAGIVAISILVVVAIAAGYALTHRAHPHSSGSIGDIVSIEVPGQDMVMVAVNVSLQNNSDKPSVIHTIQASIDTGGVTLTDDAAPAVDAQRYFEAFPELKARALNVLTGETQLNPGSKVMGTVVVSFPIKADAFAARKSLTVTITPYDELPVVMTK